MKKATKRQVKKVKQNWSLMILLIFVALFIFTLIYFNYYLTQQKQANQYVPTSTPSSADAPTSIPTPTLPPLHPLGQIPPTSQQTKNTWLKYTNSKYGYSLLYPPNLALINYDSQEKTQNSDNLYINLPSINREGVFLFNVPIYIQVISKTVPTEYQYQVSFLAQVLLKFKHYFQKR